MTLTIENLIREEYALFGHQGREIVIESSLTRIVSQVGDDPEQYRDHVTSTVNAIVLYAALRSTLSSFIARCGYGDPCVAAGLRALADMGNAYALPDQLAPFNIPSFSYQIVSAPGLHLPSEVLSVLGDAHDMERGLLIVPPSLLARMGTGHPFLPIQAIPQGAAPHDLIVEVWDGAEQLTTLHFNTVWRGTSLHADSQAWERVSYPTPQPAVLYNSERLWMCPFCQRLHKGTCVVERCILPGLH